MRKLIMAAVLAAASATTADAATTFNFRFDGLGGDSVVTAPIVGTGTFTTDTTLVEGDYVLADLDNYAFSFTLGAVTFNSLSLATPASNVVLRISDGVGGYTLRFGGSRGGPFGGAIDFSIDSETFLTFEPFFGTRYAGVGNLGDYEAVIGSNTGAVPEPASWALLITGFGLTGAAMRRRSRVAVA